MVSTRPSIAYLLARYTKARSEVYCYTVDLQLSANSVRKIGPKARTAGACYKNAIALSFAICSMNEDGVKMQQNEFIESWPILVPSYTFGSSLSSGSQLPFWHLRLIVTTWKAGAQDALHFLSCATKRSSNFGFRWPHAAVRNHEACACR